MFPRQHHRRCRQKVLWLLIAVFLFFLFNCLPLRRQTVNSYRIDRPTPRYDVADKPRFLYRSGFRKNPNHEYEARVEKSLREIEERILLAENGDTKASETIWQIVLVKGSAERGPDSIAFEMENEGWEYKLVTHSFAAAFIKHILGDVPELVRAYDSYPHDVLRADLLRYLILWYYGGYYADMDVYPARPIKSCPALAPLFHRTSEAGVSLVLGIEIDEPYASSKLMHEWHWIRTYGFIQYNMYAPRRFSPLLRKAIARVLAQTRQHYQRSSAKYFLRRYDEGTILEITGPGVFTDAILDGLTESLPETHPLVMTSMQQDEGVSEIGSGSRVTWAPFHKLKVPLFIDASDAISDMGGLAVMPIRVWGNGQRHSEAGFFQDAQACINHRFKGTWKPWKKGWREYLFG